jgi:hypothetical protein
MRGFEGVADVLTAGVRRDGGSLGELTRLSVRPEMCVCRRLQIRVTFRGSHGCDYEYCEMRAETRKMEPGGTAVAKERPRRRRLDVTLAELLGTVFSTGSAARLYS